MVAAEAVKEAAMVAREAEAERAMKEAAAAEKRAKEAEEAIAAKVKEAVSQELIDPASGRRYLWNKATGESTWLTNILLIGV